FNTSSSFFLHVPHSAFVLIRISSVVFFSCPKEKLASVSANKNNICFIVSVLMFFVFNCKSKSCIDIDSNDWSPNTCSIKICSKGICCIYDWILLLVVCQIFSTKIEIPTFVLVRNLCTHLRINFCLVVVCEINTIQLHNHQTRRSKN